MKKCMSQAIPAHYEMSYCDWVPGSDASILLAPNTHTNFQVCNHGEQEQSNDPREMYEECWS